MYTGLVINELMELVERAERHARTSQWSNVLTPQGVEALPQVALEAVPGDFALAGVA